MTQKTAKNKGLARRATAEGFGLLEIAIGISVISLSIFSLTVVSNLALKLTEESARNTQASFLLEEGVEALKILRDSSWSANIASLTPGTTYYFSFTNHNWQATSTNIYIDGIFERSFFLHDVNRDINDDIVSSGGIPDPDTKKITVSVSWRFRNSTTTQSVSAYITNLFNN